MKARFTKKIERDDSIILWYEVAFSVADEGVPFDDWHIYGIRYDQAGGEALLGEDDPFDPSYDHIVPDGALKTKVLDAIHGEAA